jgi:hypothetical protein
MVIDSVFGLNSTAKRPEAASRNFLSRLAAAVSRQIGRMWCAMHGHLILLHFEPHKLSLQCALCGYESEGWEVGRPAAPRRPDTRIHAHAVHVERRRNLRAVPSGARMAS